MLSRQLISLFRSLRPYIETGVHIPAEKVFMICAVLQDTIDEAEALEARIAPNLDDVPDSGPVNQLPDNVTRLTPKRAAKGAHVRSCPPCTPTPGPEGAA